MRNSGTFEAEEVNLDPSKPCWVTWNKRSVSDGSLLNLSVRIEEGINCLDHIRERLHQRRGTPLQYL